MKIARSSPFLFSILSVIVVRAADPAPRRRAITAEDLWAVKRPAALDISIDGARFVFTVQEYDLEKNSSQKHLHVIDTAAGKSRALTTTDVGARRSSKLRRRAGPLVR